jgi:hypothetical protein
VDHHGRVTSVIPGQMKGANERVSKQNNRYESPAGSLMPVREEKWGEGGRERERENRGRAGEARLWEQICTRVETYAGERRQRREGGSWS